MRYNNFKQNLGDEYIPTINLLIDFELWIITASIFYQDDYNLSTNIIVFSKHNSWNDDTFCYKVQSLNQACSVS